MAASMYDPMASKRARARGGQEHRLDHVPHEAAEAVAVLGGQAEHAGDHVDRDVLGVVDGAIDLVSVAEPVEQVPAQRPDRRLAVSG
jgi:hypothetical protein